MELVQAVSVLEDGAPEGNRILPAEEYLGERKTVSKAALEEALDYARFALAVYYVQSVEDDNLSCYGRYTAFLEHSARAMYCLTLLDCTVGISMRAFLHACRGVSVVRVRLGLRVCLRGPGRVGWGGVWKKR